MNEKRHSNLRNLIRFIVIFLAGFVLGIVVFGFVSIFFTKCEVPLNNNVSFFGKILDFFGLLSGNTGSSCKSLIVNFEILKRFVLTMLPLVWILLGFTAIFLFYKPIYDLFSRIATSAHSLDIGGIKFSFSEINEAITEREILKYSIFIAMVDNQPSEEELRFLAKTARSMSGRLENLDDTHKRSILSSAIDMALSDKILKATEYKELEYRAKKFDIIDYLDAEIVDRIVKLIKSGIFISIDEDELKKLKDKIAEKMRNILDDEKNEVIDNAIELMVLNRSISGFEYDEILRITKLMSRSRGSVDEKISKKCIEMFRFDFPVQVHNQELNEKILKGLRELSEGEKDSALKHTLKTMTMNRYFSSKDLDSIKKKADILKKNNVEEFIIEYFLELLSRGIIILIEDAPLREKFEIRRIYLDFT